MKEIPFRDLSVKDPALMNELLDSVKHVLAHGQLILGNEVEAFEKKLANVSNVKYAVGVNSGTDALYIALRSLDIGKGDEVITTPLSWIGTLNTIVLCGATPVFVDIDNDLNMNVDLVSSQITSKTKAVLPVHFTGRICKMNTIMDIAKNNNLYVIEDAAQAFNASLDGKKAGSFGHVNCFSMHPMKLFGAYGEAGAVLTDNDAIYKKILALRSAGMVNKYECHYPAFNGRIDTVQAAMLLVNMKYLKSKMSRFIKIAKYYNTMLKDVVTCPVEDESYHTYYTYVIITDQRDELMKYLAEKGIETSIHHPILMPYQAAYKNQPFFSHHLPVAERLVKQILCIPNHDKMTMEDADYVVRMIKAFF